MKFSIIIPVYKVEQYVERCLLSCFHQDLDSADYEIIVVNDGSPDGSLEIVKRMARTVDNVTIISQENQGQSVARNAGLKIARGEYIWFVDSDDWIEANCLGELYRQCKAYNLDILSINFNDLVDGHPERRLFFRGNTVCPMSGKTFMASSELQMSPCCYVFRREFLFKHQLLFKHHIVHEDNEFIPRAFYFADNFMSNLRALYYVFPNPTSTTRSMNPKKSFDLIKIAQLHVEFMNKFVIEKGIRTVFCNYIGLAINAALSNTKKMKAFDKEKFHLELNQNQPLFYYMKRSNKLKYRLEAGLYLFSPALFRNLYKILTLQFDRF